MFPESDRTRQSTISITQAEIMFVLAALFLVLLLQKISEHEQLRDETAELLHQTSDAGAGIGDAPESTGAPAPSAMTQIRRTLIRMGHLLPGADDTQLAEKVKELSGRMAEADGRTETSPDDELKDETLQEIRRDLIKMGHLSPAVGNTQLREKVKELSSRVAEMEAQAWNDGGSGLLIRDLDVEEVLEWARDENIFPNARDDAEIIKEVVLLGRTRVQEQEGVDGGSGLGVRDLDVEEVLEWARDENIFPNARDDEEILEEMLLLGRVRAQEQLDSNFATREQQNRADLVGGVLPCWPKKLGVPRYHWTYATYYDYKTQRLQIWPVWNEAIAAVRADINGPMSVLRDHPTGWIDRDTYAKFGAKVEQARRKQYGNNCKFFTKYGHVLAPGDPTGFVRRYFEPINHPVRPPRN